MLAPNTRIAPKSNCHDKYSSYKINPTREISGKRKKSRGTINIADPSFSAFVIQKCAVRPHILIIKTQIISADFGKDI